MRYREFRCIGKDCRQLLGKEMIFAGRLEIKCPRCSEVNSIDFRSDNEGLIKYLNSRKGGEI